MSRLAMVAVVGGLAGACTSDRMAQNPFSDPFKPFETASRSEPTRTGSIAPSPAPTVPRSTVRTEALPPPSTASAAPSAPVSGRPRTASGGAGWSTTGGTTVVVGPGETLSTLTSRYGVPAEAILSSNGLKAGDVTAGRRVVIPVYSATGEAAPVRRAEAAPAPSSAGRVVSRAPIDVKKPAPRTVAEAAPTKPQIRPGRPVARAPEPEPVRAAPKVVEAKHPTKTVAPKVAAKPEPKVEPKPVKAVTKPEPKPAPKVAGKPEPKVVAPKTAEREVMLPAKARPVATTRPTAPKVVEAKTPEPKVSEPKILEPKVRAEPVKVATAAPAKAAPVEAPSREPEHTGAISTAAPVTTTASAATAGGPDFRWPAKGRVISGFGGGGSNEGINIAVPEGTPVKAAGDGVVAYAGSEVKGYGNLVLIRHDNGYVSAYANNGDIDVKRGQRVTRGQSIAKSGQTGNVTSPQLHFEIRKGSTPVDPLRYLASN